LHGRLALVRATHLNNYISVLREIGAPVDRALSHSTLPPRIEDSPDLYVSVPAAIDWIAKTGRDIEPMALGLLGALKASLSSLRPAQQTAIFTAQTGLKRMEALAALARYEDSILDMRIFPEADSVRVICAMTGMGRHPFLCFAEWLNLQAVLSVVRSVAGPAWCPLELGFISSNRAPETVQAAFPNTRILVGQPVSSVLVGRAELALTTEDTTTSTRDPSAHLTCEESPDGGPEVWGFISLLRTMVQPYLAEGRTDVAFVAEMAGISKRTLQRRLMMSGTSYSRILQEARFELARAGLAEPGLKVIDVAMIAGYESPQHFTRAFRRFTGVTPSEYRQRRVRLETGT
jgi:AraC-like DNA-binding protein